MKHEQEASETSTGQAQERRLYRLMDMFRNLERYAQITKLAQI